MSFSIFFFFWPCFQKQLKVEVTAAVFWESCVHNRAVLFLCNLHSDLPKGSNIDRAKQGYGIQ